MILVNCKIYTMEGKVIEKGSIHIKDKKIDKITEYNYCLEGEDIIDLKGASVYPGFIDAHTHLGILEENMGFEGNDLNETSDPITPHLRGIDGINPMDGCFKRAVKAGVTSVLTGPGSANVMGGEFAAIKTYGISVDEMIIKAPVALKVAFGENPKRFYNAKGKMPITRMGTAALLRETLTKAINYKNKKQKARENNEFFEKDLKMEAILPVLDKSIPLKAHAHRADDILTALRIAKEFDLDITLDHCTEGHLVKEQIKASGKPVLLGPGMHYNAKVELSNRSFEAAAILTKMGVKVAIITDHPVVEIQYLPLSAALCVKAGMSEEEALKAITINAAEIAGIDHRVGSIKEGKDADLVIFNGNPLDNFTETLYTIVDGEIVYKNL
ncbi:Imidazolonepropionase [Clostridium amylolyticum]|uniref:Imidazolonepropionase n=1 Tax=Clostridium amylolyticum TaxID=1121298 RepID=A0A1M6MM74_9CLOT|nr:amidohydrolase [Clostridium amylolyticum]SHJ84549.1 Imidazolonepropionase [Clostridium amylolyticum]